jgi:hypothetical protein
MGIGEPAAACCSLGGKAGVVLQVAAACLLISEAHVKIDDPPLQLTGEIVYIISLD